MHYYESLQQYYENRCIMHPGTPPVWGEVGYKEFMKETIESLGIKPGDMISVEMKWHYGKIESYTGTVLRINDSCIHMLSQGNKVWKDMSNEKCIHIEYITRIEKLKDAKPDFDISKADPYYKPLDDEEQQKIWTDIEEERTQKYLEKISKNIPNFNPDKNKLLWLLFDFCWSYGNGEVKNAEINVIKKDGNSIPLPKYKNKHIYPNKDYFSSCGIKDTDTDQGGILLLLDSMEELQKIRLISCLWTVDVDGEEEKFLTMIYPTFVPGEGYVYNIHSSCTDMQMYEKSLHSHSVFSGALEKEYDKAFLHISNAEGEAIFDIMKAGEGDLHESIVLDLALCLNGNSVKKIIKSLSSDETSITEVFLKNEDVAPKGYVWPFSSRDDE